MQTNLDQFDGFDIKIEYEKICDEYAKKCCDGVKTRSAQFKHNGGGRRYADGWTTEAKQDKEGIYSVKVYNETDWQLTHLLENGHLISNKRNGAGWASAHPHIAPAFNDVKNKFKSAVRKAELKVKLGKQD